MPDTAPTIDLWSSASFSRGHPAAQYRWLRDNAPVYWHEEPGGPGFWAVTRYDLVRDASRDHGTYSSRLGMMMGDLSPGSLPFFQRMMLMMDPPEHMAHRALVSRQFIPRQAARWTAEVQAEAGAIIDAVRGRGECDFVTDVAGQLPSRVIARLLGIPAEDGIRLYQLTEAMHAAPDEVPQSERREAISEMLAYCARVHAAKLADPGDDLSSALASAEIDGKRLGPEGYGLFIMLLLNAGGDTVRNLLGGGLLTLLRRPGDLARLRKAPDALLPAAVEELLRYQSPVIYMRRTATRDTVLGDQPIAEGDKVLLYYGAANRDERVFRDPEDFILDRAENPHVAFGGHGPHYCLGAHLARIEITCMLREVLTRLPDLSLSAEPTWSPSNFISGPSHIPVTFRSGA